MSHPNPTVPPPGGNAPTTRADRVSPWRLAGYGVGTLVLVGVVIWLLAELATPSGTSVVTADLSGMGRTVGLIAAAAVGVPAAVLAYHRQRALDTANHTAARQHEHKVEADNREHRTGLERNLRERYTSCAEQLGHENSAIRLAGAYATASLADDWHEFGNLSEQQVCIDLLCSYLCLPYQPSGREQTHTKTIIRYAPADRVVEEHHEHRTEDSQVRQAILRIIAAHLRPDARTSWSDFDFDFTGAYLENTNLDHCVFQGRVLFTRAQFHGERTWFHRAQFHGETTSFDEAQFHSEQTSFGEAQFHSLRTSFDGARFDGEHTGFGGAQFHGGRTWFVAAQFRSKLTSFLEAQFRGDQIWFVEAQFRGERTSFEKAQFHSRSTLFDEAQFRAERTLFAGAEFRSELVSFPRAQFHGGETMFLSAKFYGKRTSFAKAKFCSEYTSFLWVELRGSETTSFERAEFHSKYTWFERAKFHSEKTVFAGAEFHSEQTSFKGAQFNRSASFARPNVWGNVVVDWQWPLAGGLEGPAPFQPAGVLPTDWPPVPDADLAGPAPGGLA